MANKAAGRKSQRVTASGTKRDADILIPHSIEIDPSSKRRKRVSVPVVRSKQKGTLALDNAKIFEIIPFP
ncbi:MAG TPA: hypothetical protein VK828_07595 [Terriglobales bacterium]|jgi:hypothetical protein|nr:hypothetical protein [Terriglobales bacterium]